MYKAGILYIDMCNILHDIYSYTSVEVCLNTVNIIIQQLIILNCGKSEFDVQCIYYLCFYLITNTLCKTSGAVLASMQCAIDTC